MEKSWSRAPTSLPAIGKNPKASAEAFTADGWFKTGDVAEWVDGYYRILGRRSVDIIKSGGYKMSALEIEEVLRLHESIADCAVAGVADEEWAEIVSAALVTRQPNNEEELREVLKEKLPTYKVPRRLLEVEGLPRNAMGKVIKKEVKGLFH